MSNTPAVPDLANLQWAMQAIADAVDALPEECRELSANALLNVAAEAVARDVGCAQAARIFARMADFLEQGQQPPASGALPLSGFDA